MGNRRFSHIPTSDEEDEEPLSRNKRQQRSAVPDERHTRNRKRKRMKLLEDEDDDEEEDNKKKKEEEGESEEGLQRVDEEDEPAKTVGDPVRVSGKGRGKRNHYQAFEYDGNKYELEDPVLLVPEDTGQKPYVAIIKDITQTKDGSVMMTGQWFYRPEEAERKGGGNWQSRDTRELFYSFHRDEVPAESVMHKCVAHFVPLHKQLPLRKQHPGFIVQNVYDTVERKLWKLTDKDYEDSKQHEIDLLVQKTMSRLGDLPDIEVGDGPADEEDHLKTKRSVKRRNISPLDVSREEEVTTKSIDQNLKAETPGSCTSSASEYYSILADFKALTGETHRDKCLEKLLQGIHYMFSFVENMQKDDNVKGRSDVDTNGHDNGKSKTATETQKQRQKGCEPFTWPDTAVPAVAALEKAAYDAFPSDHQKYNQKLRQLLFNLKNNALLARRLLNGELEPAKIINMSPNELKEGLTADEITKEETDESERMQMTDARCSRCKEPKVGVRDIIQAGHGDRYQLECVSCGNSWYASRDEISVLTIDAPSLARSVGAAPWATAKFEDIEKKLASPRDSDKPADDPFKKSSESYMPVLDTQKSFGKSRKDDK